MGSPDPTTTTVNDICKSALQDSGYIGQGQTPTGNDIVDTWTRLQWMLQGWERNRWMVYHLVNLGKTSTGALSYTVGPGGDYDTGAGSTRPSKISSAFLRQLQNSQPNQIDTPLEILQSREDYDRIALKSLVSFPGAVFLDTGWPLATLLIYPVPQANIYAVRITVMAQLPSSFASLTDVFNLPFEYYTAIVSNLALRMRARFQIGSFPGDELPRIAKSSLDTIKGSNTQIARLRIPEMAGGPSNYNIFSDRF
jgi:hypothetical protein